MQAYQENISAKVSGVLSPVLGVQVTVTDTGTGNPAALYSDNGVTPIAQPLVTDETGYFGFYAANGGYMLAFASAQVRIAPRTIQLYDPADDSPLTQAQAAASSGASKIGIGTETVENALNALQLADYTALRAYAGPRKSVYVTGHLVSATPSGISGMFARDDTDTTSVDNGGTVIVSAGNVRWKRQFSGQINILWFGADPSGVSDSTTSIQGALNCLPPATGGEVLVPAGTYLVSAQLTTPARVDLVGQGVSHVNNGPSASQIKKAATMTSAVLWLSQNCSSIRGITFQGLAGNTGDGIQIAASRVTLRDVGVYGMGGDGIRIGTDTGGENCNVWRLDNVKSKSNGGNGVQVSEGLGPLADANAGAGVNLDLQSNGLDGIYFRGSQLCTLVNPVLQSNTRYGLHFGPDAKYNCIFGGDIEANISSQVRIESGSEYNAIFCYTIIQSQISYAATSNNNRIECIDFSRVVAGLKFPPTQVASTDVNTLDDYEEGVFTPTISGSSTAGVGTYTSQNGRYTKVGRVVTFSINVAWTAHTGTGNTEISGLPFASDNTGGYLDPVPIMQSGGPIPGSGNVRIAYIGAGTSKVVLREQVQSSGAITNSNAITASGQFWISGTYTTAT